MPLRARIYIAFILGLGTVCLAYGFSGWNPQDLPRFLCYLALAIPASCLKVRLPGITGTMSVLFLFLLAGVAELGLAETLVIGITCVLVQSIWHAKVRPRAIQLLFNIATISSAVTAAYFAYQSPWGAAFAVQAPFRLMLAASTFFLAIVYP